MDKKKLAQELAKACSSGNCPFPTDLCCGTRWTCENVTAEMWETRLQKASFAAYKAERWAICNKIKF